MRATAHRVFAKSESGVSPVIATVMLVAIAVALAASVTILAGRLMENPSESPTLAKASRNELSDQLRFIVVPVGADWSNFAIIYQSSTEGGPESVGSDPSPFVSEAAAVGVANVLAAGGRLTLSDAPLTIGPGEYIEFCGAVAMNHVSVALLDLHANALIGEWDFQSVSMC